MLSDLRIEQCRITGEAGKAIAEILNGDALRFSGPNQKNHKR